MKEEEEERENEIDGEEMKRREVFVLSYWESAHACPVLSEA